MLDLNAMMLFAKVVEAQSYSQAARELNIPKSTISRKISQIEEQLGVRLLQRNTRGLSLTEVGGQVYKKCRNILHEAESVRATIESSRSDVAGALKVSVPISLNQNDVAALCSGFLNRYPKVDLDIQFCNGEVDLIGQGFDIVIMFGPLPSSELVARPLFEREMVLVASPDYLAKHGEPQTPQDLSAHQGILLGGQKSAPIWPIGLGKEKKLISFPAKVSANSGVTVKYAAQQGLGIAMLTKAYCQTELKRGSLVQVLNSWSLEPLKVYGLYSSRLQLAPKISVFLDFFADHMKHVGEAAEASAALSPLRSVT